MELISREAVLNAIPQIICTPSRNGKTWFAELLDEWVEDIKSIPTIEEGRPKGKWIEIKYRKPTEEEKERHPEAEEWLDCELPEHGEEVLVTTAYNNLIAMTTFANHGDDGCEFEDYDAEDIIAWCRLPEPYIADMRGDE